MTFKPGQSGNPSGKHEKPKPVTQMLKSALNEAHDSGDKSKLRVVIDAWIRAATNGESWAIVAIADRIDGKPIQESTVTVRDELDRLDDTGLRELVRRELEASGGSVAETPEQPAPRVSH